MNCPELQLKKFNKHDKVQCCCTKIHVKVYLKMFLSIGLMHMFLEKILNKFFITLFFPKNILLASTKSIKGV